MSTKMVEIAATISTIFLSITAKSHCPFLDGILLPSRRESIMPANSTILELIRAQRRETELGRPLASKHELRRILRGSINESVTMLSCLTPADLRAAASVVEPWPTLAQKQAGNYQKGHVTWQGLPITIETAKSGYRTGVDKNGVPWKCQMKRAHYGYIKRTLSEADGDHIDVFLADGTGDGEDLGSQLVFVIDQVKPDGSWDEHKCILGCTRGDAARNVYLAAYAPGWKGIGAITAITLPDFKEWIKSGDTARPMGDIGRMIISLSAPPDAAPTTQAAPAPQPQQPANDKSNDHYITMLLTYLDALIDAHGNDPHADQIADELRHMMNGKGGDDHQRVSLSWEPEIGDYYTLAGPPSMGPKPSAKPPVAPKAPAPPKTKLPPLTTPKMAEPAPADAKPEADATVPQPKSSKAIPQAEIKTADPVKDQDAPASNAEPIPTGKLESAKPPVAKPIPVGKLEPAPAPPKPSPTNMPGFMTSAGHDFMDSDQLISHADQHGHAVLGTDPEHDFARRQAQAKGYHVVDLHGNNPDLMSKEPGPRYGSVIAKTPELAMEKANAHIQHAADVFKKTGGPFQDIGKHGRAIPVPQPPKPKVIPTDQNEHIKQVRDSADQRFRSVNGYKPGETIKEGHRQAYTAYVSEKIKRGMQAWQDEYKPTYDPKTGRMVASVQKDADGYPEQVNELPADEAANPGSAKPTTQEGAIGNHGQEGARGTPILNAARKIGGGIKSAYQAISNHVKDSMSPRDPGRKVRAQNAKYNPNVKPLSLDDAVELESQTPPPAPQPPPPLKPGDPIPPVVAPNEPMIPLSIDPKTEVSFKDVPGATEKDVGRKAPDGRTIIYGEKPEGTDDENMPWDTPNKVLMAIRFQHLRKNLTPELVQQCADMVKHFSKERLVEFRNLIMQNHPDGQVGAGNREAMARALFERLHQHVRGEQDIYNDVPDASIPEGTNENPHSLGDEEDDLKPRDLGNEQDDPKAPEANWDEEHHDNVWRPNGKNSVGKQVWKHGLTGELTTKTPTKGWVEDGKDDEGNPYWTNPETGEIRHGKKKPEEPPFAEPVKPEKVPVAKVPKRVKDGDQAPFADPVNEPAVPLAESNAPGTKNNPFTLPKEPAASAPKQSATSKSSDVPGGGAPTQQATAAAPASAPVDPAVLRKRYRDEANRQEPRLKRDLGKWGDPMEVHRLAYKIGHDNPDMWPAKAYDQAIDQHHEHVMTGQYQKGRGSASQTPQFPVDPVKRMEPLIHSPEHAPEMSNLPHVFGEETTIRASGFDKDIPARFAVVELGSLAASHGWGTGIPLKNPKFPEELQPRNYDIGGTEHAKVERMLDNPDARYYLADDPSAANGSPTIAEDGTVFNGNGRVGSLMLAAHRNKYDWYKNGLLKKAGHFGIDPKQIEGMKHPVLVRVVSMDPKSKEGHAFARAGNVGNTASQSPIRTAASLSSLIRPSIFNSLNLSGDETFSEAVTNASNPDAREFRDRLRAAIPEQDTDRYFTPDGQLTGSGTEFVRSMMLARTLPVDLVESMGENQKRLKRTIEGSLPQLISFETNFSDTGKGVKDALVEALQFKRRAVSRGDQCNVPADVDHIMSQKTFGAAPETISPSGRMMLDFINKDGDRATVFRDNLSKLIVNATDATGVFGKDEDLASSAAVSLGVIKREGATFGNDKPPADPVVDEMADLPEDPEEAIQQINEAAKARGIPPEQMVEELHKHAEAVSQKHQDVVNYAQHEFEKGLSDAQRNGSEHTGIDEAVRSGQEAGDREAAAGQTQAAPSDSGADQSVPGAAEGGETAVATGEKDKSPLYAEQDPTNDPKHIVPSFPGLNPDELAIEEKARQQVLNNFPALRDRYLEENATKNPDGSIKSVVINTDEWRHLFDGYVGTNAHAVHEPASYASKKLLSEMIEAQKGKGNNTLAVYAGGGGSGKGTAIKQFFDEDEYPIRVDQVSDSFDKAEAIIKRATDAGYNPEYIFVDRKPEDAINGVIGRAVNSRKKGKIARTVPLNVALQGNIKARKAMLDILQKRMDIEPNVIDNTSGEADRKLLDDRDEAIQYLKSRISEDEVKLAAGLHTQLEQHVVDGHAAGEIPHDIAHGIIGGEKLKKGATNDRTRVPGSSDVSADNPEGAKLPEATADRLGEPGRLPSDSGGRPADDGPDQSPVRGVQEEVPEPGQVNDLQAEILAASKLPKQQFAEFASKKMGKPITGTTHHILRQLNEWAKNQAAPDADDDDVQHHPGFTKPKRSQEEVFASPEFKNWFGDHENDPENASKVVGDDGKPIVVYHGTSKGKFDAFDKSRQDIAALQGPGFYFTENSEIGDEYQEKDKGDGSGQDGHTFKTYLNLRKPFDVDNHKVSARQLGLAKYWPDTVDGSSDENSTIDTPLPLSYWKDYAHKTGELGEMDEHGDKVFNVMADIKGRLQKLGFDGFTHIGGDKRGKGKVRHRVWVAWEPNQIKSVDNQGTFDPAEDNMEKHPGFEEKKPTNQEPEAPKTPEFKNWFGDVENDPANASKVVDGNGKPLVVYHGTAKGNFNEFDKDKLAWDSLHGPGIYTTDNEDLGNEYQKKDEPEPEAKDYDLTMSPKEAVREAMRMVRSEDFHGGAESSKDLKDVYLDHLKAVLPWFGEPDPEKVKAVLLDTFYRGKDREPADLAKLMKKTRSDAKTFKVYLNIKKPFDIDNDKITGRELGYTTPPRGATLDTPLPLSHWRSSGASLQSKDGLIARLKKLGYDGFTHIGGSMMGQGKVKHRVWIAWEPNQVKAVDNQGTYDPKTNNIYKHPGFEDTGDMPTTKQTEVDPNFAAGVANRVGKSKPVTPGSQKGGPVRFDPELEGKIAQHHIPTMLSSDPKGAEIVKKFADLHNEPIELSDEYTKAHEELSSVSDRFRQIIMGEKTFPEGEQESLGKRKAAAQAVIDREQQRIRNDRMAKTQEIHQALKAETPAHLEVDKEGDNPQIGIKNYAGWTAGEDKQLPAASKLRTSGVNKALDFVSSILNHQGQLNVRFGTSADGRAFHATKDGVSYIGLGHAAVNSEQQHGMTVVHELGHKIENEVPGVREKALAFLRHRIGDEKPVDLHDVSAEMGNTGDENVHQKGKEFGVKDQFDRYFKGIAPYYCGKSYERGATEIVSMGLEALYSNPAEFCAKDPEYAHFIMGVVRGAFGKGGDQQPQGPTDNPTDPEQALPTKAAPATQQPPFAKPVDGSEPTTAAFTKEQTDAMVKRFRAMTPEASQKVIGSHVGEIEKLMSDFTAKNKVSPEDDQRVRGEFGKHFAGVDPNIRDAIANRMMSNQKPGFAKAAAQWVAGLPKQAAKGVVRGLMKFANRTIAKAGQLAETLGRAAAGVTVHLAGIAAGVGLMAIPLMLPHSTVAGMAGTGNFPVMRDLMFRAMLEVPAALAAMGLSVVGMRAANNIMAPEELRHHKESFSDVMKSYPKEQ